MAQSCDPNALALAAKCFTCLPPITLREVKAWLLCQWANNLTPVGPVNDALVTAWLATIAGNGDPTPSQATITAMNTFCGAIRSCGILNLLYSVNCFVPDSLGAALTPIISTCGNAKWTNSGTLFTGANLSVNGLAGTTTAYLLTGVIPSTCFSADTSGGLTVYAFNDPATTTSELACNDGINTLQMQTRNAISALHWNCYNSTGGQGALSGANTLNAFLSGNRTAGNANAVYAANSVTPFFTLASSATTGGVRPIVGIACFAMNTNGAFSQISGKTLSFAAIHEGLTSAQDQCLFNAVQALRVALGGGFV